MQKFKLFLLAAIGLFLLAACGSEDTAAPVVEAPPTAAPAAVEPTVAPTPTEVQVAEAASPAGATVNGYNNVVYTEANADIIGKTEKAQLLNVYATW